MEQPPEKPKATRRDPKPKQEISALDLKFLVKEWESLVSSFIRKIYQSGYGKGWHLAFEIYTPGKGTSYLHVLPSIVFLNKQKGLWKKGGHATFRPEPEKPTGFCMFLRKHLAGKRIEKISQHQFDRILEFSAGGLRLVLEFIPPGNVIAVGPDGIVLAALSTKKWRDREIRARSPYQYPPGRPDPFSLSFEAFREYFQQQKKTAAVLASDLGFGSAYANKLCSEAEVRPDKNARALEERELKGLHSRIHSIDRIQAEEPVLEMQDRERERLERIGIQRAEAKEKWSAAEALSKQRADAIYRKFDTAQALLEKLSSKKEIGFEPIVKREGLHITVELDGVEVPLDLKKTAQENASFYYDQAKKARRKIAGLETAMTKPAQISQEEPEPYPDKEAHRNWYEKFKWFFSSDGILVVAGKDADQNEYLLKNHAEPDEWCFHADIQGAAFTVIKSGSLREKATMTENEMSPSSHYEPPEQTKKEASEFAAVNSKAWTKGLGGVTVFSIQRKGLSKSAPTGMNLPKGSFMVSGQRVWYRNLPLRVAIGIDPSNRIVSGPESAIRRTSHYSVILVPGGIKSSDLSREIKSEFLRQAKPKDLPSLQRLPLDEIARHVPSGFGDIAKK